MSDKIDIDSILDRNLIECEEEVNRIATEMNMEPGIAFSAYPQYPDYLKAKIAYHRAVASVQFNKKDIRGWTVSLDTVNALVYIY